MREISMVWAAWPHTHWLVEQAATHDKEAAKQAEKVKAAHEKELEEALTGASEGAAKQAEEAKAAHEKAMDRLRVPGPRCQAE